MQVLFTFAGHCPKDNFCWYLSISLQYWVIACHKLAILIFFLYLLIYHTDLLFQSTESYPYLFYLLLVLLLRPLLDTSIIHYSPHQFFLPTWLICSFRLLCIISMCLCRLYVVFADWLAFFHGIKCDYGLDLMYPQWLWWRIFIFRQAFRDCLLIDDLFGSVNLKVSILFLPSLLLLLGSLKGMKRVINV